MCTIRNRNLALAFGLIAVATVIVAGTANMRRTIAADSNDSKLKRLLNEKVAILKQDVEHLEHLHKSNEAGFEELYAAHTALFERDSICVRRIPRESSCFRNCWARQSDERKRSQHSEEYLHRSSNIGLKWIAWISRSNWND